MYDLIVQLLLLMLLSYVQHRNVNVTFYSAAIKLVGCGDGY